MEQNKLYVIGICGKPGSGKDTIGNMLFNAYGFVNTTLKYPIEQIVKIIFGVDDSVLRDREAREQPLKDWTGWTARKALQVIGQSMRDAIGEDIWGKILCEWMNSQITGFPYQWRHQWVVTDIRTPNDVKTLRDYVTSKGGKFILMMVKRPGYGATTPGGIANHKLESYDLESECDVVFNNDSTIDKLLFSVQSYLKENCGILTKEQQRDIEVVNFINTLMVPANVLNPEKAVDIVEGTDKT